jgi:GntR family transcriptional regulator, transcriptional repressor for pyruvate dehydrogenase complex
MSRSNLLSHLKEIEYKKPSDIIIEQMNTFIAEGVLKPGDLLPSERALSERFGVGRGYVREALRKLEFYGILKTVPQKGTVVANIGVKALEGLIANILNLGKDDIQSLMEARAILEVHSAGLAAERASPADLEELQRSFDDFRRQVESDDPAIEEDLLFHIKIAEFSKNSVLRSLISLIVPDIISTANRLESCKDGRFKVALQEHEAVFSAIIDHDARRAAEAMSVHMKVTQDQFVLSRIAATHDGNPIRKT